MADEIEMKFELAPDAMRELEETAWFQGLERSAEREELVSVYFDTPRLELRKRRFSLRLRHAGDKRSQTVKADASGPFARGEWETEIEGGTPDRERAQQTALKPLATSKLWKKLEPIFETEIQRTTIPVDSNGSRIEMALDRGFVRARSRGSLFKDVIDDPETKSLNGELKWLTDQLGPARDYDVFVDELISPAEKATPEDADLEELAAVVRERRAEGFRDAALAVDGEREAPKAPLARCRPTPQAPHCNQEAALCSRLLPGIVSRRTAGTKSVRAHSEEVARHARATERHRRARAIRFHDQGRSADAERARARSGRSLRDGSTHRRRERGRRVTRGKSHRSRSSAPEGAAEVEPRRTARSADAPFAQGFHLQIDIAPSSCRVGDECLEAFQTFAKCRMDHQPGERPDAEEWVATQRSQSATMRVRLLVRRRHGALGRLGIVDGIGACGRRREGTAFRRHMRQIRRADLALADAELAVELRVVAGGSSLGVVKRSAGEHTDHPSDHGTSDCAGRPCHRTHRRTAERARSSDRGPTRSPTLRTGPNVRFMNWVGHASVDARSGPVRAARPVNTRFITGSTYRSEQVHRSAAVPRLRGRADHPEEFVDRRGHLDELEHAAERSGGIEIDGALPFCWINSMHIGPLKESARVMSSSPGSPR
jgi:inorganic triphosphatase YgiF